jgi:hypothetical protein
MLVHCPTCPTRFETAEAAPVSCPECEATIQRFSWLVRLGEGEPIAYNSFERLRDAIGAGEIGLEHSLSKRGRKWLRVQDIPELDAALSARRRAPTRRLLSEGLPEASPAGAPEAQAGGERDDPEFEADFSDDPERGLPSHETTTPLAQYAPILDGELGLDEDPGPDERQRSTGRSLWLLLTLVALSVSGLLLWWGQSPTGARPDAAPSDALAALSGVDTDLAPDTRGAASGASVVDAGSGGRDAGSGGQDATRGSDAGEAAGPEDVTDAGPLHPEPQAARQDTATPGENRSADTGAAPPPDPVPTPTRDEAPTRERAVKAPPSPPAEPSERGFREWMSIGDQELPRAPAKALRAYINAYSKNPMNVEVLARLGDTYLSLGNLERARFHYQRAIEQHPDYGPAWIGLAETHVKKGRKDEARRALQEYLSRFPSGSQRARAQSLLNKL